MATRIQLRRDTAAAWAEANPTLALGEAGFDVTNNQLRIGDGERNWNALTPLDGSNIDLSIYATKSALSSESATRATADAALQDQLDAIPPAYDDAQLQADLAGETQARINGDLALQQQLNGGGQRLDAVEGAVADLDARVTEIEENGGGTGPGPAPGTVLNWDYEGTGFFAAPSTGGIKIHPDGTAIYISKTNAAGDDITQEILNEVMAGNLFSLQVPARTAGDNGDPNQFQQFSIQQNPVSQGNWFNVSTSRIINANTTVPWQSGSTNLDMVVQMAPQTRFLLTDPQEQPEDIITDPELLSHWDKYKQQEGWEEDYIPTQQDVNRYFNDVDQVQQATLRDLSGRLEALESSGPDGSRIRLLYTGDTFWPSGLEQGEVKVHPNDATLFLPSLDLDGFNLDAFLDEFVFPGTTFLITERDSKNNWVHLEAIGRPQIQSWGRNVATTKIGSKFGVRPGREVVLVIDLAHAGTFDQNRLEGVEEMLASMKRQITSLKGEITKLRKANG